MHRVCLSLLFMPVLAFSQISDNLFFIVDNNPIVSTDHEKIYTRENDSKRSGVSSLLRVSIVFYQRYLSVRDMRVCQFSLSCSNYAMKAISDYGPFWGILMSNDRILRCNPYAHRYYPHVPGQDLIVDRTMVDYYLPPHVVAKGVKERKTP